MIKKYYFFRCIYTSSPTLSLDTFSSELHGKNKQSTDSFFSKKKSSLYNSKVANNLYFKDKYQDSIIDIILKKSFKEKEI